VRLSGHLCSWSLYFRHLVCLGHPSSPHGFVKVHQGLEEDTLGLGVLDLGIEEASLGIKDFDAAGVAFVKAQAGNTGIGRERCNWRPWASNCQGAGLTGTWARDSSRRYPVMAEGP